MNPYVSSMKQKATYWPPEVGDGFGGVTFGAPRTVMCRWQEDSVLFRDQQGREQMSNAIVYPAERLELRGYLYLGESSETAPKTLEGAFEIRQRASSPDLGQTKALNKVYL